MILQYRGALVSYRVSVLLIIQGLSREEVHQFSTDGLSSLAHSSNSASRGQKPFQHDACLSQAQLAVALGIGFTLCTSTYI